MKIKWLQKLDKNRRDSVWYGGDIVTISIGNYKVTIGAYGEIRAYINNNYYCDKNESGDFAEYLEEEGIFNDKDLKRALEEGRIEFENNNWFEAVVYDSKAKEYIDTYDNGVIDELEPDDDFAWVEDWLKDIVY